MKANLKEEIVQYALQVMSVDDAWMHREARTVDWWGQRLRQRLDFGCDPLPDRPTISAIRVTTDCLREVPESKALYAYLAAFNSKAVTSALVYDPKTARLFFSSGVLVLEDVPQGAARTLSHVAALQAAESHMLADGFEVKGFPPELMQVGRKCRSDATPHPRNGLREDYDEILRVRGVYLVHGMGESAFTPEAFNGLEGIANKTSVKSTFDALGLTAEFGYGAADRPQPATPGVIRPRSARTTLLRLWNNHRHPAFGAGCLVGFDVPDPLHEPAAANALNLWESRAAHPTGQLGAWCITERGSIGFRGFLPNLMCGAEALVSVYLETVYRSRSVRELIEVLSAASGPR